MKSALSLLSVGVDLDGVLNNLGETMLTELKLRGKAPQEFSMDDMKEYDFEASLPNLDLKALHQLFDEGDVFMNTQPNLEARRVMNTLHSLGIKTHIVTSRDFSHRHRAMTEEWLRRHHFEYGRLAIYGKKDKLCYAAAQKLDVFIEDHLPTAQVMTEVVRLSILLDQPYNRIKAEYTDAGEVAGETCNLVRMFSWAEISRYFLGY